MPSVYNLLESTQTNTEEAINALKTALEDESSVSLIWKHPDIVNLCKALEENQTVTALSLGVLGEVSLPNKPLRALMSVLQKNQHLTDLTLGYYKLDIKMLASSLKKNISLRHLTLRYENLNDTEAEKTLIEAINEHPSLTDLCIECSQNHRGATSLIEALKLNKTLINFSYLCHEALDAETISLIVSVLKSNKGITSLRLKGINDANISTLANALKEKQVSITHLDLVSNQISNSGAKLLADALKNNINLTHINLASNPISEQGVEALFKSLEENRTLEKLNLACTYGIIKLGPQATASFANFLKENSTLKHLNINRTVCDIRVLAEVWTHNKGLTELSLRQQGINGEALRLLISSLRENHTLTSLDLGDNEMRETDIPALMELCRNTPNLQNLNLSCSRISSKGIQSLATFLENNQSLTHLDLSHNGLDYKSDTIDCLTHEALIKALQKNSSLVKLSLKLSGPIGSKQAGVGLIALYQTFDEILKTNLTLTQLDIEPLSSSAFRDPEQLKMAEVYYANITHGLKRNQFLADEKKIALITEQLDKAITPHNRELGGIKSVLMLITHYIGPSILIGNNKRNLASKPVQVTKTDVEESNKKHVPDLSTFISDPMSSPPPIDNLACSESIATIRVDSSSTASSLQTEKKQPNFNKKLSFFANLKQRLGAALKKLSDIIFNIWCLLKKKTSSLSKNTHTSNEQNQSTPYPVSNVQAQALQENLKIAIDKLAQNSALANSSDNKMETSEKHKPQVSKRC